MWKTTPPTSKTADSAKKIPNVFPMHGVECWDVFKGTRRSCWGEGGGGGQQSPMGPHDLAGLGQGVSQQGGADENKEVGVIPSVQHTGNT